MSSIKKVRTAVIGCGVISDAYMQNLKSRFSSIELVACSDLDTVRMKEKAQVYNILPLSTDEILTDPQIELVINLTNPSAHYPITKKALEAGKHVYSEKMLAVTYEQGKELLMLAEQKGLSLGVAPDTFLGSQIQTARYIVEHGLIGKPLSYTVSLSRDFGIFAELLPHLRKPGGDLVMDTGCYYLTALASILGPAQSIAEIGRAHV